MTVFESLEESFTATMFSTRLYGSGIELIVYFLCSETKEIHSFMVTIPSHMVESLIYCMKD